MSEIIKKSLDFQKRANLSKYEETYQHFDWGKINSDVSKINIAYEAIDRNCLRPGIKDKLAVRFIRKQGQIEDYTYEDLRRSTNRFANILKNLGINDGDAVFGLLPRCPELYLSFFGTLKNHNVFCPLFSAFGPRPILQRMERGEARVLVTTESLYQKKIIEIRNQMPFLKHVILVADQGRKKEYDDTLWWSDLLENVSDEYQFIMTDANDLALMHFTSGTTGMPKGALHLHKAVLMHEMTGKFALDIHQDDIFWCSADPGWVTGTSYGIISPLVNGATNICVESDFNASQWINILREQKINIWYTAPTAIRMLMRADLGEEFPLQLKHLRLIASVGEPLFPEAIRWSQKVFNLPIHDNWWQTETGGIMISNYSSMDIKPGSMGKPLPGVKASIVKENDDGSITEIKEPNIEGTLALKTGWPSMFSGYLNEDRKYQSCFKGEYYLSGDLAKKDEDGYFWFIGRGDDVIKTAGHLVGPFEVESALVEHPLVVDVAVIAKPDEIAGNIIKAFIVLKDNLVPTADIENEIKGFARKKLGAAIAPKEIAFIDNLPSTRSGKVMRRLLRSRELGLPEGDTSSLMA